VNCGSGTGAVGRNSQGDAVIIPDNGYKLGSSGGGGQIATDAVRAVVRAWDGRGEPTCLTRDVLAITRQPDVPALYLAIYRGRVPKARLRSVTPLVLRAAAAGDAVSIGILRRIGEEMGVAAAAVARRLGMQREAFPFVLTGGRSARCAVSSSMPPSSARAVTRHTARRRCRCCSRWRGRRCRPSTWPARR